MLLAPIVPEPIWRYATLVPIGIVGGQAAAFAVGAVSATGFYNPFAVYAAFVAGDILTDSLYYFFGRGARVRTLAKRYAKKFGLNEEHLSALRMQWIGRTFQTMLLSKYSVALTGPMLVSSGVAELPMRKFYINAIGISVVQYALFIPLGYYFAELFSTVSTALKVIQVSAVVTVFIYVTVILRRFVRQSIEVEVDDTAR